MAILYAYLKQTISTPSWRQLTRPQRRRRATVLRRQLLGDRVHVIASEGRQTGVEDALLHRRQLHGVDVRGVLVGVAGDVDGSHPLRLRRGAVDGRHVGVVRNRAVRKCANRRTPPRESSRDTRRVAVVARDNAAQSAARENRAAAYVVDQIDTRKDPALNPTWCSGTVRVDGPINASVLRK